MNSDFNSHLSSPKSVDSPTGKRLLISLFVLLILGVGFYYVQNSGGIIGGGIALPKLLWLAFALFYWFFVPLLIALDDSISASVRQAFGIFFINMSVRAVIELWMMYISVNWHPYYGIAHDLLSLFLVVALLRYIHWEGEQDRWLPHTMCLIGLMLSIEIGFVCYLLNFLSSGETAIYYVPNNHEHLLVLGITWGVVGLLSLYTLMFCKRWLNGTIRP